MEAALRLLMPRLLGNTTVEIYPFQCKDDLLQRLPERLSGYASWLPSDWRIVVVVDRDKNDCHSLKQRLERIAARAGMRTRTVAGGTDYQLVNRLAIEELEAWYFGDWSAVKAAYPKVLESIPRQSHFRDPDAIRGGTWEAFERVLQGVGYFHYGLRKIEAARAVATYWNPDNSSSHSFKVFVDVLREMAAV